MSDDKPDDRAAEMNELLGDEFGERLTEMLEAWRAESMGTEEPAVRMWRDAMNNARIGQDYTSILIELVTLVLNLLDALGRLILALIGSLQRTLASFPWNGSKGSKP